ncbi:hypothetical protein [Luteibacter sp.]|uniref:hypothetical protein n=1 Tax=Luteibacter sp. TaxID=1886636 RepID=UPI003F7D9ECE
MIPYRGAGIDGIYLQNGYEIMTLKSGEKATSIHDIEGLDKAIASALAARSGEIDGKTFRFLRKYTDMGQRALGEILGVQEQTVSKWERGQLEVPRYAAEFVRGLVREIVLGNAGLMAAVERYNHLDRERQQTELNFVETDGGWQLAA